MTYEFIQLLLLAEIAGIFCGLVFFGRRRMQRQHDQDRITCELRFPRDLDPRTGVALISKFLGLFRPHFYLHDRFGRPTLVLEVLADASEIHYYLSFPPSIQDFVLGQLRSVIPSIWWQEVTPESRTWNAGVELGLPANRQSLLNVDNPSSAVRSVLSSFYPLEGDEAVMIQWVFTPGPPSDGEPYYFAVGRVVAQSESTARARHLVGRSLASLRTLHSAGAHFITRLLDDRMQDVAARAAPVIAWPASMTASELAAVCAIPIDSPTVRGLKLGASKQLPPAPEIPTRGLVVGQSTFSGAERPLAIHPRDLLNHMYVIGKTRSGKSNLLGQMTLQLIRQDYGCMVMTPDNGLTDAISNSIPRNRLADVVLLDLLDPDYAIGINLLDSTNSAALVADRVVGMFHNLYRESWGPRTAWVLRNTIQTMASQPKAKGKPRLTLAELPYILTNREYATRLSLTVRDPFLQLFWDSYLRMSDREIDQVVAPVINKIQPIMLGEDSVRRLFGQGETRLKPRDILEQRKIFLVPLPEGLLGPENVPLVGSIIMEWMWQAVLARAALKEEQRTPFFAFIDEFHDFLNLSTPIPRILAEAAKYRFGLILAHQELGQLSNEVTKAVMANTWHKMIFTLDDRDASALARELKPYVDAEDILHLNKYESIFQTMTDQSVPPPVSMRTIPLPKVDDGKGTATLVRAVSGKRYGKEVPLVDAEILARHGRLHGERSGPKIRRDERPK